ncbi:MAG: DegT/DnrJ/EryC1/StrS family aminotransferase [Anaerolineae bacterium]|nr:DegT/DnrJ/EryC1/StrS family aminotransferase [Anaerolineae bacterium]
MNIPFNDLTPAVAKLRAEIDQAIGRVLDRGWFIMGPENEAFEQQLATYLGVKHAIGVGNGTEAIQIALAASGIGLGDEVICPAVTAAPTALAILATGAQPVFADIKPDTCTLDPTRLEECLSPQTKAIVPVHLYGLAADIPAIQAFADAHGIEVIEDCAQSHGAQIGDRYAGTLARIGCYSFYPTKNLGAYGDGGAVVTTDEDLARRIRQFGNLGQVKRFEHNLPGLNSRLDEIQAAILQVLLVHLERNNALRRERAMWYAELLDDVSDLTLPTEPTGYRHVYHLYVIHYPRRDALREHLHTQAIGTDIHYPKPLHQQKVFAGCRIATTGLPISEHITQEILSLPMYPHLTHEQVETICESIRRFK